MKFNVADQWVDYEANVLPVDAPKVQREECQRAFYAGAFSLYFGVMRSLDPGVEPTNNDVAFMEGLEEELLAYQAMLLERAKSED